jgi:hypothetical protein
MKPGLMRTGRSFRLGAIEKLVKCRAKKKARLIGDRAFLIFAVRLSAPAD